MTKKTKNRGKLHRKIILGFFLLIFLPFCIIFSFYSSYLFKEIEKNALEDISKKLESKKERALNYLENIISDCRILSSLSFYNMKFKVQGKDEHGKEVFWDNRLREVFTSFIITKKYYNKIRYVDEKGHEVIRVESDGSNVKVIGSNSLKNINGQYYFKNTMLLEEGEIYLSPLEFNRNDNNGNTPRPVMKFSTPVIDEHGENKGIFIIDLFSNPFFKEVFETEDGMESYILADKDGRYIYYSKDRLNMWDGFGNSNSNEGIKKEFPEYADMILNSNGGQFTTQDDVFAFTTILNDSGNRKNYWITLVKQRKTEVFSNIYYLKDIFIIISTVIIIAVLIMAIVFSRYISRPIILLEGFARKISKGEFGLQIDIGSNDEIGSLTASFNEMSTTIKERTLSLEKSELQLRDLTQNLEKMVEERTEDLKKSEEELRDFAYFTSHDLMSPLFSINGFSHKVETTINNTMSTLSDLAGQRELDKKEISDKLNYMVEVLRKDTSTAFKYINVSLKKMETLITGILKLSKINILEDTWNRVDIAENIPMIIESFQFQIEEKGIRVIIKDLPVIYCDKSRMDEVFSNLIENAIKYNNQRDPFIEIGCLDADQLYRFYVKDNGIGIKEKNKVKIFQLFSQLKELKTKGYGIGLCIVKKIIDKHHGRIWVESEKDKGSTFWIELPKKKNIGYY